MLMKSTLYSIFKVGFGLEINSLSGTDEVGNKFAMFFDDASVNMFWRFGCKKEQMKIEKSDKSAKEDILSSFLIAGKDSAVNTLTWIFCMLCKHPFIQAKLLLEIREATTGTGDLSVDKFMELVTEGALDKMQYLHAVLTETLRLYPAVPSYRKSAVEDDHILPDGLRVKKGDRILYVPYAMGRMAFIWGEDAEDFRPERWIKNVVFLM
ncbi:hypothetical protein GIB67_019069 [Kingdonia uniflora]|uniref:Cytochrome P450 n=1 Tax=Kingdonia uniflora TaxID=39325 RepID=A0A7J7MZU8_9MAGN|nr:hypothetical protein GIB67_019069 [Kingdonia uniflora]